MNEMEMYHHGQTGPGTGPTHRTTVWADEDAGWEGGGVGPQREDVVKNVSVVSQYANLSLRPGSTKETR